MKGVTPTYKDGKFLNISINYKEGKTSYNLNIKDSYLLLQSSLGKLAKSFEDSRTA